MHVCLVTGSSRGFGRLICEHLAANGHRVYASMRDTSGPGADLAETCELVELDVIDGDSVALAVQRIVDREGRLDVVVNNGGYVLWGPVEETPIEEMQREFDVTVFGALRVACAAAPVMGRQGSGHYAASKFALEAFSEALAYALRPFGVRVVLVEPGSHDTTIGQSIQLSPGLREGHSAYSDSYRRMREVDEPWTLGNPHEVARAVVRAIEDDTTPLRVLLGEDAAWYIEARGRGDEEYRREIWQLWQLPD